jgi:hypothetical protein
MRRWLRAAAGALREGSRLHALIADTVGADE